MYKYFFSIILTCYNSERYLYKTFNNIFNQKYKNFEIIVTDNCSTDNTVKEIKKFRSKKIKLYLMKKNIGRVKALNFAIKKSRGEYLCILDSDDCLEKNWLFDVNQFINKSKEKFGVICGWSKFINSKNKVTGKLRGPSYLENVNHILSYALPFSHSGSILQKKKINKIKGPYDLNYPLAHDWKLFAQLSEFTEIKILPKYSVKWRRHVESLTAYDSILSRKEKIKVLNFVKNLNKNNFNFKNYLRLHVEKLALSINYVKKLKIKGFLLIVYVLIKCPISILFNKKFFKIFNLDINKFYNINIDE